MKKVIIPVLLLCCVLLSFRTNATKHIITAGDFTFSPANGLSFPLGDTVLFQWVTGTHTTTSTNVPSGAATWDSPLNSSATTFTYVPAAQGTYNYQCTFHVSMGMVGTFTVTASTGIPAVNPVANLLNVSPNPASGMMQISTDLANPAIRLFDVTGKFIRQMQPVNNGGKMYIDVSGIAAGVYFLKVASADKTEMEKITVIH